MKITVIALVGKNWELGASNELLWKIPEDMRHFRTTTEGHSVLMGRKTYQSIGKALPKRTNYVLTRTDRDSIFSGTDVRLIDSPALALHEAQLSGEDCFFVIGGGEVYRQFLDLALPHEILLTRVPYEAKGADTFFPNLDRNSLYVETKVERLSNEADIHTYTRIDLM